MSTGEGNAGTPRHTCSNPGKLRVLLLDNRDSFVWNLAQAFGGLGFEVAVERSDAVTAPTALSDSADCFVLSPGPGRPEDAGCSMDFVREHIERADTRPVLGVCLGHQAIGAALGAAITRNPPCHGKAWDVLHTGESLFEGLPNPLSLCRYHSLVVDPATLPASLLPLASTKDGTLMAMRHASSPILGMQFHPESFRSVQGPDLIERFAALSTCAASNHTERTPTE